MRFDVRRLLCLSLIGSLGLMSGCSYMTKQRPWPEAKLVIEDFVDRFVNKCVGRDIVENPFPEEGKRFPYKYVFGTGREAFKGQCTYRRGRLGYYNSYDKRYFLWKRWQEFLDIVNSRFGVIYHDATRFATSCEKGEIHDLLLRDGKTHLVVQFASGYEGLGGCRHLHWQGMSIQLNRKGLASSIGFVPREGESYLIRRIDVMNKDQLTELEKRELAMRWEQLSDEEKKERTKRIAREIRISKSLLSSIAREREEILNLKRTARRRERAREKAFLNQLDQQLAQGMMGLQQQVIEKQRRDHQRDMQNQASQVNFPATSQPYSQQVSASQIFKDIKGFNPEQLDENITYQEDNESQDIAPSYTSQSDQINQEGKAATSKVYEPAPEVIERETDSWFSDRNLAIAYARLKATNDIKDVCRRKGARSDTVTFSQIKAGNPPVRWNFSAPQCRQGGWQDEEWKCQTRVSGTCFRHQ